VRVQLLSDLHMEFHADRGRGLTRSLDPTGVDVLVLAGDVASASTIAASLRALCARYADATVVFVPGNHEFYGSSPGAVVHTARQVEAEVGNLRLLDHETTTVGGVTFAGTTLWFPDDELNPLYAPMLADFSMIRSFVPWVYRENERAVRFLERAAREADVVVTHHLPSHEVVAPRWRHAPLNRFFVCELGDLIRLARPPWWLFGHTHDPGEFTIGATRLLANPLGYPFEPKAGFRERLILEVEPRA
jgi:predicted phosphodiesterase